MINAVIVHPYGVYRLHRRQNADLRRDMRQCGIEAEGWTATEYCRMCGCL